MKKGYKIGLFFMCIVIVVLVVVLVWKRHTMTGFPNENIQEEEYVGYDNIHSENTANKSDEIYLYDMQVQSGNIITTCDTICVYENIDKKDGAVSTEEKKLPAKYIGLTREQLEELLLQDSQTPTLEDKQKGFQSQHLELFSPDKIKILRIYDTSEDDTGFYIMEVDGEIGVYRKDKKTLYFRTGLNPKALPPDVLNEVRNGKLMETELQVYHFLESYSS